MSDKTFRQEVEEIARLNHYNCKEENCPTNTSACADCRKEKFLAAHDAELERIAQGMPRKLYPKDVIKDVFEDIYSKAYNDGTDDQLTECQAYLLAERARK